MDNSVKVVARPVLGYEGLYEVTSEGEVYSLNYRLTGKRVKLKPGVVRGGYLQVALFKCGKARHFQVHRLVAEAFIPNPNSKPHIDHINTVRTDNRVENLRWVAAMENNNNPVTLEAIKAANQKKVQDPEWRRKCTKATIKACAKSVYCIELDNVFESAHEAARQLGLSFGHIADCCKGRLNTHGGYHFSYVENGERSFSQVVDTTDKDSIEEV